MASLLYLSRQQVVGSDGRPVAGAKLYTYATGTSTPKSVWTDAALTVAHANPVVADADGRLPLMYVSSGDYRVSLQTPDSTVIFTDDPVPGAAAAVVTPETGWVQIEAQTVSAQASVDFDLSVSYKVFRLTFYNIIADANGRALALRFSTDGGATFISGTSYLFGGVATSSASFTAAGQGFTSAGAINVAAPLAAAGTPSWSGFTEIAPGSASLNVVTNHKSFGNDGTNWIDVVGGGTCAAGARANALRVYTTTNVAAGTAGGSFSGTLILEGLR